jgi:hypothetical protein
LSRWESFLHRRGLYTVNNRVWMDQLESSLRLTHEDVRYVSQTIQADLDRFQRQKVADLKEMSLNFVRFHKDWCTKVRRHCEFQFLA